MRIYTIIFSLFIIECLYAQGPNNSGEYYKDADGKTGAALKTALCAIIYDRNERTYEDLWTDFRSTDARPDGKVWDMYSCITNYTFGTDQAGNYKKEGDVYNREHSFPRSWFGGAVAPMNTDLNHLYPTDGFVNGQRGNLPFGTNNGETYQSAEGFSKVGSCTWSGYSGKVFEPNDEYKGDFARTYFYMVTCYEEKLPDWYINYPDSRPTLDGNSYPGLSEWQLRMLMEWAKNDPVSEKEVNRNNAVYNIQNNRNPFIDYPELEQFIWGDKKDEFFSYNNYHLPSSGYLIDSISTDYVFYLYYSGEAELVKCKNKGIEGLIEIPSSISIEGKDHPIKSICGHAFDGCTNIAEVMLPSSLISIGKESFKDCTALTSIVIPNNVSSIGEEAFSGCERLSTVELFTTEVPSIGQNAFPDNEILYLYVPFFEAYKGLYSRIRTIGYNSCEYTYNGEIPVLDILNAPNTIVTAIDTNRMGKNAGTYYLPATFSHNSGITVDGSISVTINKKDLTASADNKNRQYGDANPIFTASYNGFVNNENENDLESKPTILCSCTPTSNVGNYDIVVDNAISNNYSINVSSI